MKKSKIIKIFLAIGLFSLALSSCAQGSQGERGPQGEQGVPGQNGQDGVSIISIVKTATEGLVDTYTIVYSNGNTSTFVVVNGAQGEQGIQGLPGRDGVTPSVSISEDGYWIINGEKTTVLAKGLQGEKGTDGSSLLTGKGIPSSSLGSDGDSYIDLDSWDYYCKSQGLWIKQGNIKGSNGEAGPQGEQGVPGQNGQDGVSVVSIVKTSSDGLVDTYTITYSDGTTSTFSVTNGQNGATGVQGEQGIQGNPGQDGHTPVITIGDNGNWYVDGADTGIHAQGIKGEKGDKGDTGEQGQAGRDGKDGADGKTPYIGENGNWWIGDADTGISATPTTYIPAIFNNYDGTMLYTFYFEKGSTCSYNGPTPTRPSDYDGDEELPYTFIGWDKPLENIQEPTIFTAQYRGKMYDITFKNYNGATLYSTQVERGHDVAYDGEIPIRNDNPNLTWSFIGWDKPLTNIMANTTFVAQFYAPNSIECVFKNYDGTVLSTQYVGNGDTVAYEGTTPYRLDDNNDGVITKYEFTGWDKSLKNITTDTVFTAQYGTNTYYQVTFVDYDDTVLYTTSTFSGGQVTYVGSNPTRPQEVSGSIVTDYTFSSWDKSLANITAPTTIRANYSSTSYTGYLVTFLDSDNSELYSHYFKEGTTATYPYETPFSYDTNNVNMFVGWSSSIKNITAPLTVTAQYKTLSRSQNGEYPQSVVSDIALISALDGLTTTNENGYYEYAGEQYEKIYAKPDDNSYTFNDGSTISKPIYYFKVEPIQWKYLSDDGNNALLTSEYILDSHRCDDSENNYKNSEIRSWLNNDFFNKAFDDDSLIATTTVDNSVASTGESSNQYVCETTYDKVFLLSRAELRNADYGFSSNDSRCCKTTEYARAKGVECNMDENYLHYGRYWTRSPNSGYSDFVWFVEDNGHLSFTDSFYTGNGVRPSLSIKIA